MGIGGAPEAVLAAAAIKCLGGDLQTRMWFGDAAEEAKAAAAGFTEPDRLFTADDLVRGESVIFAATGITDGDLLRGVRYYGNRAVTHSLVMRCKTGTVRKIETWHDLTKKTLRSKQRGREVEV